MGTQKTRTITVSAAVVSGCTDSAATNYDSDATEDDGSCTYAADDPATPAAFSSGSRLSVAELAKLNLIKLPTFDLLGDNGVLGGAGETNFGNLLEGVNPIGGLNLSTIAFSFTDALSEFLFAPLPDNILSIIKKDKKLGGFLAAVGFNYVQDLAALSLAPTVLPVPEEDTPGLFIVANSGIRLTTYLATDPKYPFVELIKTAPGTQLSVSLIPLSKGVVGGTFDGKTIAFTQGERRISTLITAPASPRRHYLTTPASSVTLAIEVMAPPEPIKLPPPAKKGFWGWLKSFF